MSSHTDRNSSLHWRKNLMGTAAVASVLWAGAFAAQAQNVQTLPTTSAQEVTEVEAIIVTGTAIRGVAPVGSATVGITQQELVESPARDSSSLITQLPQASSLGTTLGSTGGRASGVNLRGLGNNATLVMFDSRRVVPQGGNQLVSDPNLVPFLAVERVEVVTDGASAIYGSDAVAGVVNYILRRNYDGAEIRARHTNSLYSQYQVEGVVGRSWGTGSLMLAAAYDTNDGVPRNVREYMMQDLRQFGGNDNRFIGTTVYPGATPSLIIGNTVYGLPASNGAIPDAAAVLGLQNNPELRDNSEYYNFYSERERRSLLLKWRQQLNENVEFGYTGIYNRRTNSAPSGDGFERIAITLTPSSPYYIPGMPNPTANQTVVYNYSLNHPNTSRDQNNAEETINHSVDLTVDMPRDFQFTAIASYGWTNSCNVCQPQVNTTVARVIGNDASWGFNPFLQGEQAGAQALVGGFLQNYDTELFDVVMKVDGPLFDLPAGTVRIAAGAEYAASEMSLHAQNTLNLTGEYQTSRLTSSDREMMSAFAEVFVPLMPSLDLSMALRYDDYSDAGNTTNPKIGLTWRPTDEFLIRGSWGTSFRAPTLIEANPATVGQTNRVWVSNGAGDPNVPIVNVGTGQSPVLNRGGNTAGLRPETAEIWSLGAEYNPNWLPDLRLSLTYYNVAYEDRIENLPNATLILSSPEYRALYDDFWITAPQPASCVNGDYSTYNPLYLPWLSDPNTVYSPSTINDCQLVGIIAGGRLNLGQVNQDGLDFSANYRHTTDFGDFTLAASFSKILNLEKSVVAGGPLFDNLDTIGFQVSERGRLNLGYRNGGFNAFATANYVGSYLNNATITVAGVKIPDTEIPAWTTLDMGASYTFGSGQAAFLNDVRVSVTVQNVTDEDPPIVLSGTSAYDSGVHNPFGRVWGFEISKRF